MYTQIAALLLFLAAVSPVHGQQQEPSVFVATMLLCDKGFCMPFIDQSGQMFKTRAECDAYNEGHKKLALDAVPKGQVSVSCVEFRPPQGRGIGS